MSDNNRLETRPQICPYCGDQQTASSDRCSACHGLFEPLSRQASQNAMGPWFIRDEHLPFRPGCNYQTLIKMIRRGRLSADSVLRGPTTNQFWMRAGDAPGVSHLFGSCYRCREHVTPTDVCCEYCGALFQNEDDRQFLGLAPVRNVEALMQAQEHTDEVSRQTALASLGHDRLRIALQSNLFGNIANHDPSAAGGGVQLEPPSQEATASAAAADGLERDEYGGSGRGAFRPRPTTFGNSAPNLPVGNGPTEEPSSKGFVAVSTAPTLTGAGVRIAAPSPSSLPDGEGGMSQVTLAALSGIYHPAFHSASPPPPFEHVRPPRPRKPVEADPPFENQRRQMEVERRLKRTRWLKTIVATFVIAGVALALAAVLWQAGVFTGARANSPTDATTLPPLKATNPKEPPTAPSTTAYKTDSLPADIGAGNTAVLPSEAQPTDAATLQLLDKYQQACRLATSLKLADLEQAQTMLQTVKQKLEPSKAPSNLNSMIEQVHQRILSLNHGG